MISLKDLLEIPRFSDIELITNPKMLDNRIIESVEITETPDVENYIPRNVLILSTGMVFKEQQKNLIPFIQSLIRAEAIGLCIKVNRFLNRIDQEVINYANKMNFPLLIIPDHYPLGSLLHQIMNVVLQTQQEEIDFALDIQKKFSNLLVQDASNDLLIRELSQAIKTPIILLDPFKKIISASQHFKNNRGKAEYYISSLFKERKKAKRKDGSFLINETNGTQIHLSLIEIKNFAYFPHYLVIVAPEQVPFPTSIFAIEQAAMVFRFNLYKDQKIDESLYANEAHFFNDLIDSQAQDISNWENWFQVSRKYNYVQSNYYQVISVFSEDMHNKSQNTLKADERLFLSYCWLRKYVPHYFENALVIWRAESQEIVIILQEKPTNLTQKLINLSELIKKDFHIKIAFSVGYSYSDWQKIEQSYTQAKLTHSERKNNDCLDTVLFYKDKGMYQLFNNIDKNEITYFCKSILKEFAYPEEEAMMDLRETLDVYLKNQSEITQTAKDLFIHRNTVNYRINRCEEILGVQLDSPEDILNIRLALNLSKKNAY